MRNPRPAYLENASTIEKESFKKKVQKEQKKKNIKIRFYHSFLTIVLLCCALQLGYSALLNISKIVLYQTQIIRSKELQADAQRRNDRLKDELENHNSMQKVEAIARNNLKMAEENEVLVIISRPDIPEYVPKTFKEKLLHYFSENVAKKMLQT
jgi:cell division protein FtsB